jgi:hypothetical protein
MRESGIRRLSRSSATKLRVWWAGHGTFMLRVAIDLMAIAALFWLVYQLWRLLGDSSPLGAIDLKQRYGEVQLWFSGKPVYGTLKLATYPPATYVLLWPFLGWLTIAQARYLWAGTTVLALGWLTRLFLKESLAQTNLERIFVALIPLSIYATGATIGNGQLIVHLLPCLVAGLLLSTRGKGFWSNDLLASCLVIFALVKPSVSAAFLWILLFCPGRLRPTLLVACGYIVVTLLAGAFQELHLSELIHPWLISSREALAHLAVKFSNSNLHSWSAYFGLERWHPVGSLLMLIALGIWTYCHQKADLWILIGVTALVARFHTYHGWYDDLLVALPLITLFRIAKSGRSKSEYNLAAGLLLAMTLLFLIAPGGLYLLPFPWNSLYVQVQTFIWMTVLMFLLFYARQERKVTRNRDQGAWSSEEGASISNAKPGRSFAVKSRPEAEISASQETQYERRKEEQG